MTLKSRKTIFIISGLLIILLFPLSASGEQEKDMSESKAMVRMDNRDAVPPPGVNADEFTKPSQMTLKKELTDLQYKVTQEEGTEAPFRNEYWDNHEDGIYVDIVSGEPLFSSTDKFESGTGWPSFTRPIQEGNITAVTDSSYNMLRTEVRSYYADSHLGHLFNDGPAPTGARYCINSASLRFIPVEKLEEEGYGQYLPLFEKSDM